MEKEILIKVSKKISVAGTLTQIKKSKKLLILVHGLTGSRDEHIHFEAAKYFSMKGYDVYRFNYYGEKEEARKLHKSSIKTHNKDLKAILEYFQKDYSQIHLVGHSLGGPSIMGIKKLPSVVKKIVLWDPSVYLKLLQKRFQKKGKYIFFPNSGKLIRISHDMYKECGKLDNLKNMSRVKVPLKVIFAKNHKYAQFAKDLTKKKIQNATISGATHCFREEGKMEELFKLTGEFFEK